MAIRELIARRRNNRMMVTIIMVHLDSVANVSTVVLKDIEKRTVES